MTKYQNRNLLGIDSPWLLITVKEAQIEQKLDHKALGLICYTEEKLLPIQSELILSGNGRP